MVNVEIENKTVLAEKDDSNVIQVKLNRTYLYNEQEISNARDWAVKVSGKVQEEDYSAKAYAVGGVGTEENNAKYYSDIAKGSLETIDASLVKAEEAAQTAINASLETQGIAEDVRQEGVEAVTNIQMETATGVDSITTAGTTQLGLVNSAGTSQVASVTSEGNTQVARVQTEGNTQYSRASVFADQAESSALEAKGYADSINPDQFQAKLTAGDNITIVGNVISSTGGSGGTSDHSLLTNRNIANQHTIGSITDLQSTLDSKADSSDLSSYATVTALNTGLSTKANTSSLSDVATSGAYSDLTGLPNLSQYATTTQLNAKADTSYVNTQLGLKANTSDLANKVNSDLTSINLVATDASLTNGVHTIQITANTTFTFPSVVANRYNQIEVLLEMNTVRTINFGTNVLFYGGEAPDMSTAGNYHIWWTYDPNISRWVCGGAKVGA